jgi:hypothetical protein
MTIRDQKHRAISQAWSRRSAGCCAIKPAGSSKSKSLNEKRIPYQAQNPALARARTWAGIPLSFLINQTWSKKSNDINAVRGLAQVKPPIVEG